MLGHLAFPGLRIAFLEKSQFPHDDLEQAADQRKSGIFALTNSCSDLGFGRQAQGFHIPILTGFVTFDNAKGL